MAKVTFKQDDLNAALAKVARSVPARSVIPILRCVLLTLETGGARLAATDLDVAASVQVAAAHDGAGQAIAIVGDVFSSLVGNLPTGSDVLLSWSDETRVELKCGRSRYKLNCQPTADWPEFSAAKGGVTTFDLPADDVRRALAMSAHCMSTEETRFYLNGVALQRRGEELLFVATDGHRLARFTLQAPAGSEGMADVIIPSRAISELSRLLGKFDGALTFSVAAGRVSFAWPRNSLESKLIDATYPDYARVIPKGNDQIALIDGADLLSAVNRLRVVAAKVEKDQGISGLKFLFSGDTLTISAQSATAGNGEETLKFEADKPFGLDIGFNPTYLAGLAQTIGADVIRFQLNDSSTAAILAGQGRDDVLFVLMPMRV